MPQTPRLVIAIDGPAGAGKSTVARNVARQLGYAFLDTGAMYRAATLRAVRDGLDLTDREALTASTRVMRLAFQPGPDRQHVLVDGCDVTDAIRTPTITALIHHLDQIPEVRAILSQRQQEIASQGPTVAEGRDMGTVVFPDAFLKVFMTAPLDDRAHRRWNELREQGKETPFEEVREDMRRRDEACESRAEAPLRQAVDAILLDTAGMTAEEAGEAICVLAKERL